MSETRPVSVRGGSAGIEAHCEQMFTLARLYAEAALESGEQALVLHGYLIHPSVLAATALDPIGAADFAAEMLAALDGPAGLSWRAVDWVLLGAGLRGGALAYLAADRIEQQVVPSVHGIADAVPAVVATAPRLARGDIGGAADEFVARDPGLADLTVNAVTRFWTDYALVDSVAAWPDGRAKVTAAGVDGSAGDPPRDLPALLSGLARRNRGRGGDIDVRIVIGPGGARRVIADIPGTKNWSVSPRERDVTSAGTNFRAISGARTSYQEGVLEALRLAGVTSADEILLVGHSQGGMVAVNTAAESARTGEFRITHVVTAGAPIARLAVPRSVQVLAVENDGDVVPHCDGAGNPDRTNITTVTVHRNHGEIDQNHSLEDSYLSGAGDIAASRDASARDYLAGLRPFLTGDRVQTQVFHIERR